MTLEPRGIRNNNPGNIKINENNKWQGRILTSQNTDGTFEQFHSAVMGIRAMTVLFINYYDKYNITTIYGLIDRWAPGSENDTSSYIRTVSRMMKRNPKDELDLHSEGDIRPLIKAVITHENGQMPYTESQITEGLSRAGVIVSRSDLKESRSIKGASVAGLSMSGTAAIDPIIQSLNKAEGILSSLVDYMPQIQLLLILVALGGIGITVYARWDDRRKGLR